jgi:hypothetical protein
MIFPIGIALFVAALGTYGLVTFIVARKRRLVNLAWKEVCARLGLTLTSEAFEEPAATGEYGQHAAQMYQPWRLLIWRRTSFTRLRLGVKNRNQLRMKITSPKSSPVLLGDFSSSDAVHTGVDALDRRFAMWGSPRPAAAMLVSDTSQQNELLSLPGWVQIEVNGPSLSLDLKDAEQNVELLVSAFKILDGLANRIEGN